MKRIIALYTVRVCTYIGGDDIMCILRESCTVNTVVNGIMSYFVLNFVLSKLRNMYRAFKNFYHQN